MTFTANQIEAEACILGGLPVIVTGRLHPAEPDVGIFSEQPEVDAICWPSGKPLPDHMLERMTSDDHDACYGALLDGAMDHAAGLADYRYEQRRDAQLERACLRSTHGMGEAA